MPFEQRQLRFIDVFAGCGGLSLGLSQAGFQGVFAVERDDCAFKTFEANFLEPSARHRFRWPAWLPKRAISIGSLLRKYKNELAALEGKIDILAGGPPCQGFSSAGRRQSDDPRNQLFRSYLKLVRILRPKVVLIENVRGFTVDFKGKTRSDNYSAKLTDALSKDYVVHDALLNLSVFGVPQNRVRYIVIAFKKGTVKDDPFVQLKTMLPTFLREVGLRSPVPSSSAISDLEVTRCGSTPSTESDGFQEIGSNRPSTQYQRLMAAETAQPSDLRLANHTQVVAKRFSKIIRMCHKQGRLNTSLGKVMREQFGLKKLALRVLDPDRPAPTITSMPDDLLHYKEPRILTVRENARLQSFPDWFCFKGKYTTGGKRRRHEVPRYTQVANAVPPLAARALGTLIRQMLEENTKSSSSGVRRFGERISKFAEIRAEAQ